MSYCERRRVSIASQATFMTATQQVLIVAILLVPIAGGVTHAGTYVNDFNTDSTGGTLFGSATLDSGNVRLTDDTDDQRGSFIIDDLDSGVPILSFLARFEMATGPGTSPPADGMSFIFGQLPSRDFGEEAPFGLNVSFDTFDNGGGEAPSIEVKFDGVVVSGGHFSIDPYTNGAFVPVAVSLDPDGTVDVTFNSMAIFSDLPTGFVPQAGDRFGFGGRTGGFNQENRIDNVRIVTVIPEPSTFTLEFLALAALYCGAMHRS
jgi:hypothetical protein